MAKIVAAIRFLLLASTLVHKTYLCDGSVTLQAISQGLASFNTQIIGADVDLFYIIVMKENHRKEGSVRKSETLFRYPNTA